MRLCSNVSMLFPCQQKADTLDGVEYPDNITVSASEFDAAAALDKKEDTAIVVHEQDSFVHSLVAHRTGVTMAAIRQVRC